MMTSEQILARMAHHAVALNLKLEVLFAADVVKPWVVAFALNGVDRYVFEHGATLEEAFEKALDKLEDVTR